MVLETKEIVVAGVDACEVDGFTRGGLSDAVLLSLTTSESPSING